MNRGYCVLFALLPWSLECSFGAWKINLPSEPIIAALGIGLFGLVWKNPGMFRELFSHSPVLKISFVWIGWLGVSACFSTLPTVSWKYWVVEAGHWWVFAVGMSLFPGLWLRAFRLFAFSMAGVVVYTLIHHAFYHFRADQALLAPMPFFPENTLYAAVLSMVLMVFLGSLCAAPPPNEKENAAHPAPQLPFHLTTKWWLLPGLFAAGLFFSFCRAAWLSVLMAGAVGMFLIFRKKWLWFALVGGSMLVAGFLFRGQILGKMAADVSFLERLNRYACALRMANDRPWAGFGPGTFQFQYIPFQKPEEMTRISATAPVTERSPRTYGRGGGAHSEYFQALAEAGWPGLLLWLTLVAAVLWAGFRNVFSEKNEENQWFALALTLSLLTFFLHGLVNNMLHDGRVGALVWGMVAVSSGSSSKQ
ncbi:MAG: hypothetical protein EPGJADBJ_02361 [Saprospiraceae bacterium]|nr:hypothetical protein [Saprospiraceae bacterium]